MRPNRSQLVRPDVLVRARGEPLKIPPYGSLDQVHPDLLYFDEGVDGYRFWMFYEIMFPDNREAICLVRSNDGLSWTDSGIKNPIISPGGEGDFDSLGPADPNVVVVDGSWYLFYSGWIGTTCDIGLAVSRDGKEWTKSQANPVLKCAREIWYEGGGSLMSPAVRKHGSEWLMWYTSMTSSENVMNLALSTDGLRWTRWEKNPVMLPSPSGWDSKEIWHISVVRHGDEYWCYYVGSDDMRSGRKALGFARSMDGIAWNKSPLNPVMKPRMFRWDNMRIYRTSPIFVDGELRVYYSAYKPGRISLAKATVEEESDR